METREGEDLGVCMAGVEKGGQRMRSWMAAVAVVEDGHRRGS